MQMRIAILNAEIDRPLLIKGVNLGNKPGAHRSVSMQYCTELNCLLISFKGGLAVIPAAAVNSMEVVNPYDLFPLPAGTSQTGLNQNDTINSNVASVNSPPSHAREPISAQVETPTQPKVGATGRGEKVGKSAA